jgi:dolichyl-phosphate beta-glucosyltransferase
MWDTVVVVPCYNEERRLPVQSFLDFVAGAPGFRFLFVNDGSSDGTSAVLEQLCARNPVAFVALQQECNRGKAEAVRAGLLEALSWPETRFAGFWDADLATPLDAIPEFRVVLETRPDIQMVMGARVQLLGRRIVRDPKRHYLGRVFATVASLVLELPVYDTQCGAKLMRNTDLVRSVFASPFLSRWIFDVEMLARLGSGARAAKASQIQDLVFEYPLMSWVDVHGSKLKARDYLIAMRDMHRIRRTYFGRAARRAVAPVPPTPGPRPACSDAPVP